METTSRTLISAAMNPQPMKMQIEMKMKGSEIGDEGEEIDTKI